MKSRTIASLVLLTTFTAGSFGQAVKFNIGSFRTHQLAQVESVTDFETFTGRTDAVTGSITFDAAKKSGSGRIVVDVASIDTGIPVRNDHMKSPMWLDAEKFKTIVFETSKVQNVRGDNYRVTGAFTMHGVTKNLTINATVKRLAESDATRKAGFKGDVLQVKTSFKVKLSDFGIKIPGQATGKVSNDVTISVTVYGQSGS